MGEAECQTADWRAIGYEDGAQGYSAESFGGRRKACAEHGVTAKFDGYLAGHAEGLARFCRPQNGYQLGTRGYRYTGICPVHLEGAFLAAHADGYGLYERRAAVNRIGKRLSYSKRRASEIEYLVVEKTTLMLSPTLLGPERALIAVELKQLVEEKTEIERSIPQLEVDHAEAQRDYEAYRNSIANRHRG
jgi:hypothetical protein